MKCLCKARLSHALISFGREFSNEKIWYKGMILDIGIKLRKKFETIQMLKIIPESNSINTKLYC